MLCRSLDTRGSLRTALLRTLLDRAQHQARYEEISRQERREDEHPEQAWPGVNPCPQDQPRGAFIHFIQDE